MAKICRCVIIVVIIIIVVVVVVVVVVFCYLFVLIGVVFFIVSGKIIMYRGRCSESIEQFFIKDFRGVI